MDLRQLEYFVHVAELGSFTRASELLDVAQSALSRHVRALEVELRQNLLLRTGRGVIPTEAGKRLLSHGRGVLQQFQRLREAVEDVRGAAVGHVVVGFPHSVARILTVGFVRRFRSVFPEATVGITEGLTIHLHEWLLNGRIDIALLHDPVPSPALHAEPLQEEDLFLLGPSRRGASLKRTISLKELATFPLIIPSRPHPLRMLVETQLLHLGKQPDIVLEVDSVAAIADLVAEGFGFAVVTPNALLLRRDARRLSARRIVSPRLRSVLVAGCSAERPMTALARETLQLLKEIVPAAISARHSS